MIPGEYILSSNPVICNENRKTEKITVKNTGDRPCQIGSHTHFFEVNKALDFPRQKAYGYRLNIPAGTSIRFEPGDSKEVELCEFGWPSHHLRIQRFNNGRLDFVSGEKLQHLKRPKNMDIREHKERG